jgi:hypothetical protein
VSNKARNGPFAFNTEPFIDEVLSVAADLKTSGKELLPYYKFASFMGTPVVDVESCPINDELELRKSFFEIFLLLASLEDGYVCFYYVPLSDQFMISVIQVDTRWSIATKSNYLWNDTLSGWEIADADSDMETRVGIIPANVYQAVISTLSAGMANMLDYKLVKDFLCQKGYTITDLAGVEDDDILQMLTSVAFEDS